jgi:hypothetical protein
MSALPPKADVVQHDRHVRLCHKQTHALQQKTSLLRPSSSLNCPGTMTSELGASTPTRLPATSATEM